MVMVMVVFPSLDYVYVASALFPHPPRTCNLNVDLTKVETTKARMCCNALLVLLL